MYICTHTDTYANTACSKVTLGILTSILPPFQATWPKVLAIHVPQKEQRCPCTGHQGEAADLVLRAKPLGGPTIKGGWTNDRCINHH